MTPILDNGPVGSKLTIAVVGDGFAAEDQDSYNSAVDDLLLTGMLGHDLFAADKRAFNVHRINLVSNESGVGTKTYDAAGNVTSQVDRDTALNLYYSGDWAHCWLEGGQQHEARLAQALKLWVPDYRYVLILLNDPGYGGCGGGGRAYVPLGVSWPAVAHEFGHAFGLADEYCGQSAWTDGDPGVANLTADIDRSTLKWRAHVALSTPLPTGVGPCAGWTNGEKPPDWDDSQGVGVFEGGGGGFQTGIYRPVVDCRMRSVDQPFCPVCQQSIHDQISPYLEAGAEIVSQYVRLLLHFENGELRITDADVVDGPLVMSDAVVSGLAHEVRVDGRRVAFAVLPDANVNRSFAEPGSREHHVYERETYDFVARVPRDQLRGIDPAGLTVDLLDVRTSGANERLGQRFLADLPEVTTRRVASAQLPDTLRAVLG